jgi:hypothetical protein
MLGKFGICTSFPDMEPQAYTPHLELLLSNFHVCTNAGSADPGSIPDTGKNFSNGKK